MRKAARQYAIAESDWLDLSTGIAPWAFPIPPIPAEAWGRLPEADDALESTACVYYGAPQALAVPGSQAAIQALPRLRSSGKVGVLSPCYAEHAHAWRRSGFLVREVVEHEVDYFLDSLDVLVVVNPNNPTGLMLSAEQLLKWHARLALRGGWLVIDEAFMDSTPGLSVAAHSDLPGLIVLRSFGKFFGLAGVRLGFVLAEARLLKLLRSEIGPWAVSGPTRIIGEACLRDTEGQQAQRQRTDLASQRLAGLLTRHGLTPHGGCALFQRVITAQAAQLYEFCAGRGILLRLFVVDDPVKCSLRFGLPREDVDWQRLDMALLEFHQQSLRQEQP